MINFGDFENGNKRIRTGESGHWDYQREIAGLNLPFGWDSALVNLILYPITGIWILFYFYVAKKPTPFWVTVPFAVLLGILVYLRFRYRRSTGRSSAKRNEYGFTFYSNIAIGLVAGAYIFRARAKGLDTTVIGGGLALMVGVFGVLLAIFMKGRLYYLGGSIPIILLGISFLIWTTSKTVILNSCPALIIGGIAMGCIQAIQLKANERINAINWFQWIGHCYSRPYKAGSNDSTLCR